MNPIFKAGDLLNVVPYRKRTIRVGDIVVFYDAREDRKVVHRVVHIDACGARTRGDNSLKVDDCLVTGDMIIGRVDSIERSRRQIPVRNGRLGSLDARLLHAAKHINMAVSRRLRPLYHGLARSGVLRRPLAPFVKPRVVCYRRPTGTELQLLLGRWVIGRRLAGQDRWLIRRPFRLIVDETLLVDDDPA